VTVPDPDFAFTPPPEARLSTPKHRIVARVPAPDDAASAVDALAAAGVDKSQIFVLCGEDGLLRLDPTGQHHGLQGRLVRASQTVFALGDMISDDAEFVARGGLIVTAPARDADERRLVAETLRDHGGTDMRYFGATTFEEIG
jgi:hypothetical protein